MQQSHHTSRLSLVLLAVLVGGCADSLLAPSQPVGITVGAPSVDETASDDVTFTVTYDGADVVLFTASHVQVVATGSATATATVAGDGATRTVTLTSLAGDGTLSVALDAGSAASARGQLAPQAAADWTVLVDNTPPTLATAISPVGTIAITASGQAGDVPLTWAPATDAGTAVVRYEVAIGSTPGGSDVRAFTDAGAGTAYTATNLTLNSGVDYWFAVRAVDRCGNVGAVGIAPVWHPGLCGAATVALGNTPTGVAASDFDGDGDLDLAVSIYSANQFSVLLNDGRGSFTALTPQATGNNPLDIAGADVNADGIVDLVVCHSGSANVGVYLGNGDGTFGTVQTFATPLSPWWLRIVDCDGINGPDLIVGCENTDTVVSVLLNNGDGSFAPRVDHTIRLHEWAAFAGLVVADLDGDADVDIAVASNNDVRILRNAGDGTFGAPTTYAVGAGVNGLVAADLNRDGKPDLATATSGSLVVLQATGGDDPAAFSALPGVAILPSPYAMASGDIDGDGDLDLVVTEFSGNNSKVQLLRNDGSGGLTRTDLGASRNSYRCALVRMNGNSFLDVVVSDLSDSRVTILLDPAAGCVF